MSYLHHGLTNGPSFLGGIAPYMMFDAIRIGNVARLSIYNNIQIVLATQCSSLDGCGHNTITVLMLSSINLVQFLHGWLSSNIQIHVRLGLMFTAISLCLQ